MICLRASNFLSTLEVASQHEPCVGYGAEIIMIRVLMSPKVGLVVMYTFLSRDVQEYVI